METDGCTERYRPDTSMTMGAIGGRSRLFGTDTAVDIRVDVTTDARWARRKSDAVPGLVETQVDVVTRVRASLEGETRLAVGAGELVPSVTLGLRHDGGDAETGAGIEAGAGLAFQNSRTREPRSQRADAARAPDAGVPGVERVGKPDGRRRRLWTTHHALRGYDVRRDEQRPGGCAMAPRRQRRPELRGAQTERDRRRPGGAHGRSAQVLNDAGHPCPNGRAGPEPSAATRHGTAQAPNSEKKLINHHGQSAKDQWT